MVYVLEAFSGGTQNKFEFGAKAGLLSQIVTALILGAVIYISASLDAGMLVVSLLLVWLLIIAANNTFTTYFNSISQERLAANERGKYISNIITIFTLGNSFGTQLFGWVLSLEMGVVLGPLYVLMTAVALKVLIFLLLQASAGRDKKVALDPKSQ